MQSLLRGLPPGGPQKESLTRQKQKGGGARLLRTHSGDEVDGHRRWDRGVGRGAAAVDEAEVPEAEVGKPRRVSADLRRRKRAGARAAGAAPPATALRRVYGSRDRRPVGVVGPLLRAALLVGFGADLGTPPEEEGGLPPTAAALLGLGVVFGDGLLKLAVEGVERARVTALRVPPCLLQHLLRRAGKTHTHQKHAGEERVNAMKAEERKEVAARSYLEVVHLGIEAVVAVVVGLRRHRKNWILVHLASSQGRRRGARRRAYETPVSHLRQERRMNALPIDVIYLKATVAGVVPLVGESGNALCAWNRTSLGRLMAKTWTVKEKLPSVLSVGPGHLMGPV